MRGALPVLLVCAATTAWTQQAAPATPPSPAAIELFDRCANLASDDAVGLESLESECPGLTEAIDASAYAPFISESQREELTAESLDDLHALLSQESAGDRKARTLDPAELAGILEALESERQSAEDLSWWERFKRWLRERFAKEAARDSWLASWLEKLSIDPAITGYILVASIILIILLALIVIANELRVAGVFRRSARRGAPQGAADTLLNDGSSRAIDLDAAPLAERPSLLLRMLIAALMARGRVSGAAALTTGELLRRIQFADDAERACFQRVALLAERIVYGRVTPKGDLEPVLAAGRDLYARWERGE